MLAATFPFVDAFNVYHFASRFHNLMKSNYEALYISETEESNSEALSTGVNSRLIAGLITVVGLLVMLWHILAPLEPSQPDPTYNYGWGVSFYASLPSLAQILGFVVIAVAILWALFAPVVADVGLDVSGERIVRNYSRFWKWFPWVLALVGVTIFIIAPAAYSEGD